MNSKAFFGILSAITGAILCYFVWIDIYLAIVCAILMIVGLLLCKINVSNKSYWIVAAIIAICLFPVLYYSGILFVAASNILIAVLFSIKEALTRRNVADIAKRLCRQMSLFVICVVSLYLSLMLRGMSLEIKKTSVGKSFGVCFPYPPSLNISYAIDDDTLLSDATVYIIIKNTKDNTLMQIKRKGNRGSTGYHSIKFEADIEYAISLESDEVAADIPCTITFAWTRRLSDPFFYGIHKFQETSAIFTDK